jgi:sulfofructose kinase
VKRLFSHGFEYDVVGQGICAVDYLCRLPRYPELDQKTELLEFSMQGGGPVPTALAALARLGTRCLYLGKVGDDEAGRFVRRSLEEDGVDTGGIVVSPPARTPRAFVWIDGTTGLKSIAADRTGIEDLQPGELCREQVASGRFLLIDGKEGAVAIAAARWSHEAGAEVVLDVGSPRERMEELLAVTDYLVASESFVRRYAGGQDPREAVGSLSRMGPQVVVVTMGKKGCICLSPGGVFHHPAFSVPVVDTTGAGDVFHGGFLYGLLSGWDLPAAVRFASAAAALKCRHIGGRSGIPTLDQVERFLLRPPHVSGAVG